MRQVLLALAILVDTDPLQAGDSVYSTNEISALEQLAQRDNFQPSALYTGVKGAALRTRLNSNIHDCVREAIAAARNGATSDEIVALIKESIWHIPRDELETEDAEHYALGYEAILDALEIESSNGVLNNWMYGFDVEA
jgi:hypothetical protein